MTKIISPKVPQALTLSDVLEFNQPSTHVNKVVCLKGLFFLHMSCSSTSLTKLLGTSHSPKYPDVLVLLLAAAF